jgi:hypothetical protein
MKSSENKEKNLIVKARENEAGVNVHLLLKLFFVFQVPHNSALGMLQITITDAYEVPYYIHGKCFDVI